jgi:hypothetical protein
MVQDIAAAPSTRMMVSKMIIYYSSKLVSLGGLCSRQ